MILTSPVASATYFITDALAPGKPVINNVFQEGRTLVVTVSTPTEDAEGGDLSGLTGLKVALVDYSVDVNAITFENLTELSIAVQTSLVSEPGVEVDFVFSAPYLGRNIQVVAFAYQDTSVADAEPEEDFIEDDSNEPQA